jgi:hypothetical protein
LLTFWNPKINSLSFFGCNLQKELDVLRIFILNHISPEKFACQTRNILLFNFIL